MSEKITVAEMAKVLQELIDTGRGHYSVSVASEYVVLKKYTITDPYTSKGHDGTIHTFGSDIDFDGSA